MYRWNAFLAWLRKFSLHLLNYLRPESGWPIQLRWEHLLMRLQYFIIEFCLGTKVGSTFVEVLAKMMNGVSCTSCFIYDYDALSYRNIFRMCSSTPYCQSLDWVKGKAKLFFDIFFQIHGTIPPERLMSPTLHVVRVLFRLSILRFITFVISTTYLTFVLSSVIVCGYFYIKRLQCGRVKCFS